MTGEVNGYRKQVSIQGSLQGSKIGGAAQRPV